MLQPLDTQSLILRLPEITSETHEKILTALRTKDEKLSEQRFESIGPSLGKELRTKTLWALTLACLFIIAYIAFTFRGVSRPVASWKYGTIAVIALLHDVGILVGVFVVLGKLWHIEVDTSFVAALLTTLGYSVTDTIVVFDRVRERLPRSSASFADTVNESLNITLARSLFTSLTTILAILPVYLFGGETVRYFALALVVGIGVGTYSSIFVASPLLVLWQRARNR